MNARTRRKWLTDGSMTLRTSQPGKTARFDWGDDATRVQRRRSRPRARTKATVAVAHERLPDPDEAEVGEGRVARAARRLKSFLETQTFVRAASRSRRTVAVRYGR